jgi:hypothetical protein
VVDVVEFDDFSVVVAKNRKVEIVVLGEGLVREGIVDADPDDLRIDLVQLLHVVTQGAHFTGADAGECSGEKCEYCCAFGFQKLLQAARFSIGVWDCKVRSFLSLVHHRQSSLANV